MSEEPTLLELLHAEVEIDKWRKRHNRTHSTREHAALEKSGRMLTPDAAYRLTPFGFIDIDPDEEVAQAMLQAPRAPVDDVEGTVKGGIQIVR